MKFKSLIIIILLFLVSGCSLVKTTDPNKTTGQKYNNDLLVGIMFSIIDRSGNEIISTDFNNENAQYYYKSEENNITKTDCTSYLCPTLNKINFGDSEGIEFAATIYSNNFSDDLYILKNIYETKDKTYYAEDNGNHFSTNSNATFTATVTQNIQKKIDSDNKSKTINYDAKIAITFMGIDTLKNVSIKEYSPTNQITKETNYTSLDEIMNSTYGFSNKITANYIIIEETYENKEGSYIKKTLIDKYSNEKSYQSMFCDNIGLVYNHKLWFDFS